MDEIFHVGPKFDDIVGSLWPFKLSTPRLGFSYRGENGVTEYGNREDKINDLVYRMTNPYEKNILVFQKYLDIT